MFQLFPGDPGTCVCGLELMGPRGSVFQDASHQGHLHLLALTWEVEVYSFYCVETFKYLKTLILSPLSFCKLNTTDCFSL